MDDTGSKVEDYLKNPRDFPQQQSLNPPTPVYYINLHKNTINDVLTNVTKQLNAGDNKRLTNIFDGIVPENVPGISVYPENPDEIIVNTNYQGIDIIREIYEHSDRAGGSRRRRPSRKYKKSKRVLRRKSRSTRRR